MSRAPKCRAACALRAASIAPKPSPNSTVPPQTIHSDGARASRASASAVSKVPAATSGPTRTHARMRPVAALDTTEAVIPKTSRIPRAPTGSPKLSRIEGQSRPRVEPGKATLRYARQASRRGGTGGCPSRVSWGGVAVPRIGAARDDGSGTSCVSACVVARAPQLLECLYLPARKASVRLSPAAITMADRDGDRGGLTLVFAVLAVLAGAVAGWAAVRVRIDSIVEVPSWPGGASERACWLAGPEAPAGRKQPVQHFIASYGIAAVFLLMLAESACIPVPSEVIMLLGGALRPPRAGRAHLHLAARRVRRHAAGAVRHLHHARLHPVDHGPRHRRVLPGQQLAERSQRLPRPHLHHRGHRRRRRARGPGCLLPPPPPRNRRPRGRQ